MSQINTVSQDVQANRMLKFIGFLYRFVAYFAFFATILYALYAIGIVSGLVVPTTIDTGSDFSATKAFVVSFLSMLLP
ncbi:hypothetical protein [Bradyrhizobium sp.]|jgi:hypothetical protein|uniref:hypothetical protein n=1 Tax=Bradyrhizobium sp. TaxID=376 RepID=UPI003C72A165